MPPLKKRKEKKRKKEKKAEKEGERGTRRIRNIDDTTAGLHPDMTILSKMRVERFELPTF